eukprot:jgi/Hompol1/6360/HPOL_004962-RA
MLKLERTLSEAKAEHSTYAEYLATLTEQIKANERSNSVDSSITDEDIEELKRREESAISVLCDLERESQDLQQELYQAEAELAQTEALEQEYWQQVNTLERELASYQNQLESINLKYEHVTKRLNELTKTNAYSDTFRIWHDGLFGTINGLRLGRLQSHPVEWSEINAAIGQTVLLLDTLANKLGFTFAKLIPMGSFSRIERTDGDKSVYELYGSSDIAGVLFWNRRFDFGLVAFLNCLQQLGDFAEQQDPRFRLPYRINKDKIGDVPIRLQFNLDESWTKALKYTLIDVNTLPSVWFLSAPGNPTKQDAVTKLKDRIASKSADHAEVFLFNLPEFKIGTLDTLVTLSDELAKNDQAFEAIVMKIADGLRGLLNNDLDQWKSNLAIGDKRIDVYLKSFQWNSMKYRVDKTLKELSDTLQQEVNSIDALMKTKTQTYSQLKSILQGIQRKTIGNLAVRSLNDVVKKEHFVLDSEYLVTLLVAVPKASVKEWIDEYETITQMVVPRSTQKIAEDDEYALFNVTLFQRVADEFANKARERKFIVRDFKWNPEQLSADKKQLTDLTAAEREQWSTLLRLSKTNFGELYSCWIHVKALRTFVESILRYGLPANFQPITVVAKPKQEKKVRELFNKHFAYLDGSQASSSATDEAIDDNLQHFLGEKDYCPAVLFPINVITG